MASYKYDIGDKVIFEGNTYTVKDRFCNNNFKVNEYRLEKCLDKSDMYTFEHRLSSPGDPSDVDDLVFGYVSGYAPLSTCECSAKSDKMNPNLHDKFCPMWNDMFKGNKLEEVAASYDPDKTSREIQSASWYNAIGCTGQTAQGVWIVGGDDDTDIGGNGD